MYQGLLALARFPSNLTLAEILARQPKTALFAPPITSETPKTSARWSATARVERAGLIVAKPQQPFLRRAVRSSMGPFLNCRLWRPPAWFKHCATCRQTAFAA